VLFYAVAVFVSFMVGLVAVARFAMRERKPALAWVNGLAAAGGRIHARCQPVARPAGRCCRWWPPC